ncbi:rubrerythrin family protein [Candidatus Woesearchaeota archaeon]|mgnify:CR=1 FL=1|jgi:rubrerythrin|nr:rubrerythrin family protein [Candidatus Woesearchaeota archaeon]MBT7062954.1 rubrerythrin family protein [Candidatus Woesearchaeota archaeon]MBT7402564.1 rubrerythrin family protein [Candidatus Woesearchaeota archaeon]
MKKLKGTQTEKNLWAAFAGESQARNKYEFFAKEFKKAGYEQIAAIFQETANNEKEHAKREFKYLVKLGDLKSHLKAAIDGEHYEQTKMYPDFAKTAKKEGFKEIAKVFEEIAKAEIAHEKRFDKLLKRVKNKTVFKEKKAIEWKCANCGYVHKGKTPPKVCPACAHPKSYFERLAENY